MFDAKSLFEMMVKGAGGGQQGGRHRRVAALKTACPISATLLRQFTEGGNQGGSAGRNRQVEPAIAPRAEIPSKI